MAPRIADNGQQAPRPGEQTGRQGGMLTTASTMPGLSPVMPGTYNTYRMMRRDPTIALARSVVMAPIIGASWSFEARKDAPDEHVEFIREQIEPMRTHIVREALRALDFGWAGFEKVFELVDGRLRIERVKPLLHDVTEILIEKDTGRFAGFRQGGVTLDPAKAILYTHDREGDNYHGRARLENVRAPWSWWNDANEAAARYDTKIAGVMPIIHYPPGESYDKAGKLVSNHEIAQRVLDNIAAGKGIAVENRFMEHLDDRDSAKGERRQWMIELLEDKGTRQAGFKDRLSYLDALKFRGMLRPERSALEGQHGTKAEAGVHGDVGLTDGELIHLEITDVVNKQLIDQILLHNFGSEAEGSVWVTPAPLRDIRRDVAIEIIKEWGSNPDGREDLREWLDFDAILDLADLPKSAEVIEVVPRTPGDDPDDPGQFSGPMAEQMRRLMQQTGRGAPT